ncbi:MAG: orotate phosphoribosyltransferase [Flavobacteriales bacterium]|jgi:orotate phosphoribosyltransferase|nr:orotate phosphoribosyltransferase [Flavobacteriales bacterium]
MTNSLDSKTQTALKTAEFLLQIKAIKLQPANPFTWASGWKSPIYCDNRIILSHPSTRNYVREELKNLILDNFSKPDVIAGVATGAIAHGVLIAEALGVPFVYVRPEPKKHGRKNQIEGYIEKGQSVVVVEDLISTGMSSLNAYKALVEFGCVVKGMAAIFSYDFDIAKKNFEDAGCELHTLSSYPSLLKKALETGYISEEEHETLGAWRENPSEWNN